MTRFQSLSEALDPEKYTIVIALDGVGHHDAKPSLSWWSSLQTHLCRQLMWPALPITRLSPVQNPLWCGKRLSIKSIPHKSISNRTHFLIELVPDLRVHSYDDECILPFPERSLHGNRLRSVAETNPPMVISSSIAATSCIDGKIIFGSSVLQMTNNISFLVVCIDHSPRSDTHLKGNCKVSFN